jgi:mRNA-degrading endonuclease toxin of MazEF toxin-antitoxin module
LSITTANYKKGDIVYTYVQYTQKIKVDEDQEGKDRTVLILIDSGNQCVVCTISKNGISRNAFKLNISDCKEGKLSLTYDPSFARLDQIHTIHKSAIRKKIGELQELKLAELITTLKALFDEPIVLDLKPKAIERPKKRRI